MFDRTRFDPPDKTPFKLGKKDRGVLDVLAAIDLQIDELMRKKLGQIRKAARRQGIIAEKLENLKSESGQPFAEEKKDRESYRIAVVRKETKFGSLIKEVAYLCRNLKDKRDMGSCGWVKGSPRVEKYDNIGVMSGSAGFQYSCKICGKPLGREVHTRS